MVLDYTIRYFRGRGPEERKGSVELRPGVNIIAPELPKGKLFTVAATLRRQGDAQEKIFIICFCGIALQSCYKLLIRYVNGIGNGHRDASVLRRVGEISVFRGESSALEPELQ